MSDVNAGAGSQFSSVWRYQANPSFYDEMIAADGSIRRHWRALGESLSEIEPAGLTSRWEEGRRLIHENGITYNVYGDPQSTGRPWPLDPIPLVIAEEEWNAIDAALRQRATLLNAMLADFYGPQRLLHEGLFPPELVLRHPGFLRPCSNLKVPGGIFLHNYSADLARSPDGRWWVIADRTQAPSGAGYALENRLVTQRVLPELFRATRLRRLAESFQSYREMLQGLAPHGRENPRIVLLTPGPYNETYFEHAFLARYQGYTLVEGGDLTVRDNHVYLKTLVGLLPVDVIARRQDDGFCDPLELREDSVLGIPGLVQAVRMGNVAVANALGSGLIESAALAAFLPGLCHRVLDEGLKMPTVATWWCGEPAQLDYVIANIQSLVLKPSLVTGRRVVFGTRLSAQARQRLIDKIRLTPSDYCAQEQVALSTCPVWENGRLAPRHLVLRVFVSANQGSYQVMPGGLTRVTSGLDSLVASMQEGGGSKDTWILSAIPPGQTTSLGAGSGEVAISRATFDLPSRVADNLYWLGRYVERVDAAVRVARAILSRLQEPDRALVGGLEPGLRILSGLGYLPAMLPGNGGTSANLLENDLEGRIFAMLYDSEQRTSVGWTLHQLRRIAWLLRDRFSADAWRILNRFTQQLSARPHDEPVHSEKTRGLLDDAVVMLSAFSGLAAESMTRGDGWRFLEIGRRLERALQIIELLRHGIIRVADSPAVLQTLLEIADSSLTYRSRYLTSMQADLVVDLLLLDEANPRSAAFQLARLNEHIAQLPRKRDERRSTETRIVLRLLNAVQLVDASELVRVEDNGRAHGLDNTLGVLSDGLRTLSEAIVGSYFDHLAPHRLAAH